jgi:DNA polymerase-3 subunit delta'
VIAGELANAVLFHGPQGTGKQRLGLWLAQLLVCQQAGPDGPCGRCHPCRLASHLQHPDIHWFFPLARPRVSGGPEKLAEALEEARAAELEARRADPFHVPDTSETAGLYLAHVQLLRRMASNRPAMGGRKVFLVGDAEALVPQEASPEAANALLKLLEEPPADTVMILTASDPEALLPTIRSRLLPIRVSPLPEAIVADFLKETRGLDSTRASAVARLSGGAIGRALALAPNGKDAGPLDALRAEARDLLEAALANSALPRLALAHAQAPAGARGSYSVVLDFLALWIRDVAAVAAGARDAVVNVDALDWLAKAARALPPGAPGSADAIHSVATAASFGTFNINPQLTTAWLLRTVAAQLRKSGPEAETGSEGIR